MNKCTKQDFIATWKDKKIPKGATFPRLQSDGTLDLEDIIFHDENITASSCGTTGNPGDSSVSTVASHAAPTACASASASASASTSHETIASASASTSHSPNANSASSHTSYTMAELTARVTKRKASVTASASAEISSNTTSTSSANVTLAAEEATTTGDKIPCCCGKPNCLVYPNSTHSCSVTGKKTAAWCYPTGTTEGFGTCEPCIRCADATIESSTAPTMPVITQTSPLDRKSLLKSIEKHISDLLLLEETSYTSTLPKLDVEKEKLVAKIIDLNSEISSLKSAGVQFCGSCKVSAATKEHRTGSSIGMKRKNNVQPHFVIQKSDDGEVTTMTTMPFPEEYGEDIIETAPDDKKESTRRTVEIIKKQAFQLSMGEQLKECGPSCTLDKKCLQRITLLDAMLFVSDVYGDYADQVISSVRTQNLGMALERAYRSESGKNAKGDITENVSFIFSHNGKQDSRICERAFCILLKISDVKDGTLHSASSIFKKTRKEVVQGNGKIAVDENSQLEIVNGRTSKQSDLCIDHMRDIVDDMGDTSPTENIIIIPYSSIKAMWEDFAREMRQLFTTPTQVPSLSTFRKAFKDFKTTYFEDKGKNIRLSGSKGAFKTCDICNNVNDLLSRRRYDQGQREIIKIYRKMHLQQQAAERRFLEENKNAARRLSPEGTPKELFMYADAMTAFTSRTPKMKKQMTDCIENRIMGVEVICGPDLDTTFLYHSDQLVSGGANYLIEVIRQCKSLDYAMSLHSCLTSAC